MAAEGRRMEVNVSSSENMEGANYPDSVNSSPRSRDTDTEYFGGNQRWDAVDPGGSGGGAAPGGAGRVRLMCSCGGKILPRPHDNQLAYVGGDTRILAVERNIRFATMINRLSSLWGTGVSFKYQLPNEDLDALVSVTNDEDLENMMAEYDRLHKSGYKFSRLRLFVFPNTRTDTGSAPSSISSAMEESGKQWFVDALNNPPVSQASDATDKPDSAPGVSETSVWVNNMPDYLFGLEGQHGNAANVNAEGEQKPSAEVKQQPPNYSPDQAEKPANFAPRGFDEAPRRDPVPVPNPNMQKQEAYCNAPPAAAAATATQIPVQEFQKLNLRQPPPVVAEPPPPRQEENPRKMYAEPARAPEVLASRPITPESAYQIQPEYYLQDHHHQQQLQQQQQQQLQQQHQAQAGGHMGHPPMSYFQVHDHSGVYLVPAGSHMMHQMPGMRPVAGQPAPPMQYYNPPIQRMPVPAPAAYDAPPPVTTVRASAVPHRQEDQYREQQVLQQQPPPPPMQQQPVLPMPKVAPAYGAPPPTGGMVYRAPAPGAVHPGEPAAYPYQQQQHVMYEPNPPRQVYYAQAPNPTYQPVAPPSSDVTAAPSEQVKQGRVPTQ
uniref:TSA: Wollemia nobilis Ref_Wollemi_Transcript_9923_2385 transcribed RNA sequence n=1 Tax=Wollemia nobilis TaxID=56998 RepID=A0A0C9S719_9CONI